MGKTVSLPKNFHSSWHLVFENLYGDECITFIEEVNRLMNAKNEVTGNDLHELREKIKKYRLFPKKLTKGG